MDTLTDVIKVTCHGQHMAITTCCHDDDQDQQHLISPVSMPLN